MSEYLERCFRPGLDVSLDIRQRPDFLYQFFELRIVLVHVGFQQTGKHLRYCGVEEVCPRQLQRKLKIFNYLETYYRHLSV